MTDHVILDRDGDQLITVKAIDLQRAVDDLTDAGKDNHALYRLRDALRAAE